MRHRCLLLLPLLCAFPAAAETIIVTRFDDPLMDGCTPDDCSLREAVAHANAYLDHDTIVLATGTYVLNGFPPDRITLQVEGDLTIRGAGRSVTTIRGGGQGRLFSAYDASLSLRGMTLRDGLLPAGDVGGGGAIWLRQGRLELSSVLVQGNDAGFGGGIAVQDASLRMIASTVADNTASWGGGIHALNANILLQRGSRLVSNTALRNGGALSGVDVTVKADDDSEISFNGARHGGAFSGGGMEVYGVATQNGNGLLRIANNHASDEEFGGWGGAFSTGDLHLDHVAIESNTADYGGGIHVSEGALTIRDSSISGNLAWVRSGGVDAYGGEALLERVAISGNEAGERIGAMLLLNQDKAVLRNVDIYGNRAPLHAAIHSTATLSMSHVTIWNNLSDSGRDAVNLYLGSARYSNSILFGRCTNEGGGSFSAISQNFRGLESTAACSGSVGFPSWLERGLHGGAFEVSGIKFANSPLIDSGSAGYCEKRDVRGAERTRPCDIGAFEYGASP